MLPERGDFVIAADAGYVELVSRGITPDLVVGDFDSLGFVPEHPDIVCSPAKKNDTDMLLSVKQGLALGYKTFFINGGLGGRLDHTLANIQVLVYISKRGARGILLGHDICISAISNEVAEFESGASGYVSIFSAGSAAEGVTLTGFKYPLDNATLECDYPLGVSNEFTGTPATIAVRNGALIITWAGEPGFLAPQTERIEVRRDYDIE
jgi:thiamine pyrophosphokinase